MSGEENAIGELKTISVESHFVTPIFSRKFPGLARDRKDAVSSCGTIFCTELSSTETPSTRSLAGRCWSLHPQDKL